MECGLRKKPQWCRIASIVQCDECPHWQLTLEERIKLYKQ